MSDTILVINAGSSSIKFQVFALNGQSGLERQLKGQIESIAVNPHLIAKNARGVVLKEASWPAREVPAAPEALGKVVEFLVEYLGGKLPIAVGHRVVHGGIQFSAPTVVTPNIAGRLKSIAPDLAKGNVIVAHLGSGASMCALANGRSIDSSMGFTALDGLPMGTRPGQLDAGVILYLLQQKGMTAPEIERLLYNDCGLKGLSGQSNDVRVLLQSSDPRAQLAIDFFVHRIAQMAGSLGAALQGIDGFVFTAGVGENAPAVRAAVVKRLGWLGAELDEAANMRGAEVISSKASRIECRIIPTDEELMIAEHTLDCLQIVQGRRAESTR